MTTDNKSMEALVKIARDTLVQVHRLLIESKDQQTNVLTAVKTFLLEVVSVTINSVESGYPESAALLYGEMETAMKEKGLREIADVTTKHGGVIYTAANIDEQDMTSGMNYIGQQLSITLLKSLCELPKTMRHQDMVLRAIGTLLINVLNQNSAPDSHQVLDRFCERVHQALHELTKKTMH